MEMKAQRKPGLNVPNVSGQVGAGGTEGNRLLTTLLTFNRTLSNWFAVHLCKRRTWTDENGMNKRMNKRQKMVLFALPKVIVGPSGLSVLFCHHLNKMF